MAIAYNSNYEETMPFSDTCAQINCGVGVAETYTVPGTALQKFQAYFEYASNSNVFVRLNSVPTSPTIGTTTEEPYSEFKPKKRYVTAGDVIQFITPDTNAYIGVSLRQVSN